MSYNKEELLGIISKMQQAGESEENIAAVIKEYELKNPRQSGNTTGSSADATAKPKTAASNQNQTDSQSETGSSDLQSDESWGSKFQSFHDDITLQPDQVSQIQTNIIPEKDLKQVEQIDKNKKKQSDNFLLEMDKAFQPKGSLFGKIVDRTKNINIQEAATLNEVNPQQYLTDIVKEELGGMSNWFFDEDLSLIHI